MADEVGQDPVEVETAPDVGGDAPERLGSMQQVGDILLPADHTDDRAERIRDHRREVAVGRVEPLARARATTSSAPHGPSRPGIAAASSSRSPGSTVVVTRSLPPATTADAPGASSGPRRAREVAKSIAWPRTPNPLGSSSSRGAGAPSGTATEIGHESLPSTLPDRDQRAIGGRAQLSGDAIEILLHGRRAEGFASDRVEQCEVAPMPDRVVRLELERIEARLVVAGHEATTPER